MGFNEKKPSERKLKYPKSVFFIIGNEFCERFTYYGLRTVLTLYLTQRLYYSENTGTMIYHSFTMLAYFTPVIGAIIADSFLGKFRTILYLSILYTLGCITLSFGAYPNDLNSMVIISLVGLVLIAFGTGGIKPCVSAFGGDQFKEGQEKQLAKFFSIFYLSINLGSVFSTFITPILREDVKCFGEKTCFSLAFGVPAALMIVALFLFICGKPLYTIRPPSGNIVLKVAMCICHAISKKCNSSEKKRSHWLDYADDKYDKKLIGDIKILLKVFVLYIPLPLFWALFDQQGSRWTLQATRLNGKFEEIVEVLENCHWLPFFTVRFSKSGFHLKSDQMQVVNPLLIIIFIPFFDYVVYPALNKLHVLRTSLQRMAAGGILAAVSFIVAGFLELSLEGAYPVLPGNGYSQLTIINNSPCNIKINGADIPPISAFESAVAPEIPLGNQSDWIFNPENCTATKPVDFSFFSNTSIESMMITLQNNNLQIMKETEKFWLEAQKANFEIQFPNRGNVFGSDTKTKTRDGEPLVRIFYNINPPKDTNVSFHIVGEEGNDIFIHAGTQEEFGMTDYVKFTPGRYKIYLQYNETNYHGTPVLEEEFKSGGIYIVNIYEKSGNQNQFSSTYRMVKGNEISILLQLPQYIIITAGEIMFSITGLEFSYSQSPNSMKSVVQAAWLLTVAFGNLIVMVIAELHLFSKISYELFLFATLMFIDMAIFAILAYFYKYVTIKSPGAEEVEIAAAREKSNESHGRSNEAYDEERF